MESGGWKKFMENPIIQINNPFDLKNKKGKISLDIYLGKLFKSLQTTKQCHRFLLF
jgi:hypothetical protein